MYDYQARRKVDAVGLTYNTESIYCSATPNVADGPVVIETPPNILGVIDDGWMRYVTDLGNAGPDRGEGGSFLLVRDAHQGELPSGHHVFRTPSYKNWVMARAFVDDTGEGDSALRWYRENLRIYPLATGPDPDASYVALSQHRLRTTHVRDVGYFERLAEVVDYEPAGAFTPYQLGLLKAIGIEKGRPFRRNDRMHALLGEGIEIGDAIARPMPTPAGSTGYGRTPTASTSTCSSAVATTSSPATHCGSTPGLSFNYEAIVVTPAMAVEMVGVGSQYLACTATRAAISSWASTRTDSTCHPTSPPPTSGR